MLLTKLELEYKKKSGKKDIRSRQEKSEQQNKNKKAKGNSNTI